MIPALRRQRQVDFCEFKARWVYSTSSRTARDTQRNPVSRNKNDNNNKKKGWEVEGRT